MKRQLIIVLITCMLVSCKKDLMKEVRSEAWNNERAILQITFENQVGNATIRRDEAQNGLITFMYNQTAGDAKNIKIKELELSYGASADVIQEQILTFDDNQTAQIKVTSKSGKDRIWKISYIPFSDELVGTWQISTLSVYGGAWPEYGGAAAYSDMAERSWNWKSDGSGPVAEYDNTLTFSLEGITEDGDAYGKIINHAGQDQKYADFIFVDDPDGAKTPIDVNNKYRKIPMGEGSWKRNSKQGTISFSSSSVVSTAKLVGSGTIALDDYNNSITIEDKAFEFELQPTFIWIDIYKDRERFVENAKRYWVQIKKISE